MPGQTSPSESAARQADLTALLAEFTARVDRGESVADLLQADAVIRTPRGETRGRDTIAALFASVFETRRQSGHAARHTSLNVHVRAVTAGRFEVRSLLLAFSLAAPDKGEGSLLIGDQIDIVALEADGEYRFAARTLTPALEFSLVPKAPPAH
jgi:hypothetical protein